MTDFADGLEVARRSPMAYGPGQVHAPEPSAPTPPLVAAERTDGPDRVRRLYESNELPFDVDAVLPRDRNPWSVSDPMARLLVRLVVDLPCRSVLEFGAGWSSVVLANALQAAGGGRLTSVEHQTDYLGDCWDRVARTPLVDATLVVRPLASQLSRHGLLWRYAGLARSIAARAPFDLVVIDAPPGVYGRSAPLFDVYALLAPGAVIVLDDARRPREQTAVARWLATFPGLQLVVLDETTPRGMAVLRHDGNKRRRLAPRTFAGSIRDRLRESRERRRRAAAAS